MNSHDRAAILADAAELRDLDELVAALYVSPLGLRSTLTGRRDGATVYTTTLAAGRE
jgi:hypothetical protein